MPVSWFVSAVVAVTVALFMAGPRGLRPVSPLGRIASALVLLAGAIAAVIIVVSLVPIVIGLL